MKVKVATTAGEMRKIREESSRQAALMTEAEMEEDLKSKGFIRKDDKHWVRSDNKN